MSNPNIERREIIDAQYHARELQMKAILTETQDMFMKRYDPETNDYHKALFYLLSTPPKAVEMMFDANPGMEQDVFEKAAKYTRLIAEKFHVLDTLGDLTKVTGTDKRGTFEVAIDYINLSVSPNFKAAFTRHPEFLNLAATQGREKAWITILNVMQKEETPLLRLRRDMAVLKGLQLKEGINNGMVGSLATKVPNVDLRYFYPKGEQIPKLSFVINPFEW